jgi:MscS family membrane protein
LPNGHISNVSLENFSLRDKFWFHQFLSLRKETSSSQIRSFVESATRLLTEHPNREPESVRVSFIRLGTFSLELEIFAYIRARDWSEFLQIQGELLLRIMEILQEGSIQMAVEPRDVSLTGIPESNGESPQAMVPNFVPHEKATIRSPQRTSGDSGSVAPIKVGS